MDLLGEYGIVHPQGIGRITQRLPANLKDAENELSGAFRLLLARLTDHLRHWSRQLDGLEQQVRLWHCENEADVVFLAYNPLSNVDLSEEV